jgi:hypothetical protein
MLTILKLKTKLKQKLKQTNKQTNKKKTMPVSELELVYSGYI